MNFPLGMVRELTILRSLNPSASRPQTPNSLSRVSSRNTRSPPPQTNSLATQSLKNTRTSLNTLTSNYDWGSDEEDGASNKFAQGTNLSQSEDEDEFGLPSISNLRRSARNDQTSMTSSNQRGLANQMASGALYNLDPPLAAGRARANSSDIALERGPPSYPSAKAGEGKILRPQYKDILRGESSEKHEYTI